MDSSTPLWVTLLVAALGIVGTLIASLVSGAAATRREQARAREDVDREADRSRDALELEVARSREALERETSRRLDEEEAGRADLVVAERRAAYTEFMITAARWSRYVAAKRDQRAARSGALVPLDVGVLADEIDHAYAVVQLLGDASATESAARVHHNLLVTAAHLEATHFSPALLDQGFGLVTDNLKRFVDVARDDLGIAAADGRGPSAESPDVVDMRASSPGLVAYDADDARAGGA